MKSAARTPKTTGQAAHEHVDGSPQPRLHELSLSLLCEEPKKKNEQHSHKTPAKSRLIQELKLMHTETGKDHTAPRRWVRTRSQMVREPEANSRPAWAFTSWRFPWSTKDVVPWGTHRREAGEHIDCPPAVTTCTWGTSALLRDRARTFCKPTSHKHATPRTPLPASPLHTSQSSPHSNTSGKRH